MLRQFTESRANSNKTDPSQSNNEDLEHSAAKDR